MLIPQARIPGARSALDAPCAPVLNPVRAPCVWRPWPQIRFHGCGGTDPPGFDDEQYAVRNDIVLLHPGIEGYKTVNGVAQDGNNAMETCNSGTPVARNCKEIARGCWDGYGQLSVNYMLKSNRQMQTVWNMIAHIAGI